MDSYQDPWVRGQCLLVYLLLHVDCGKAVAEHRAGGRGEKIRIGAYNNMAGFKGDTIHRWALGESGVRLSSYTAHLRNRDGKRPSPSLRWGGKLCAAGLYR